MSTHRPRSIGNDCKGSVALWIAAALPALVASTTLATEAGSWVALQNRLQRAADAASVAGALIYKTKLNAQVAAGAAANLAELNGAMGTATRSWNSATNTLTDNRIVVAVVPSGGNSPIGATVTVSVTAAVPLGLSVLFYSGTAFTVAATSTASVTSASGGGAGGQPCMLALSGDDNGVTTGTDVTLSGNTDIVMPSCTIRSNAGISMSGNAVADAAAYYAGGAISISGNAVATGARHQNAGQIADPYATAAPLQAALTAANNATVATDLNCTNTKCTGPVGLVTCANSACTIAPGTYGRFISTGNATVTMRPGTYVLTGGIALSGNGAFTGSGVTILMAGGTSSSPNTVSVSQNAFTSLVAATTANVGTTGAIPGILFASTTTGTATFSGNAALPFSGVIYVPNGNMIFSGNSTDGATGCAEVIAETIAISGNVDLASVGCPAYGAAAFGSVAAIPVVVLSQ